MEDSRRGGGGGSMVIVCRREERRGEERGGGATRAGLFNDQWHVFQLRWFLCILYLFVHLYAFRMCTQQ